MSEPRERDAGGGGLLRVAVDRPVTVVVTAILVVFFGALSVVDLPIQLTPDIGSPTILVDTVWPGASPSEIEREILLAQEDVLKDVPGLVRMTSQARYGAASLTLELEVGTNIDDALVRVTNRLTEVEGYPDSAQEPSVSTSDDAGPPLVVMAVRSRTGGPVEGYRTWLAETVAPELQRVPGVGGVDVIGGRDTVFQIDFEPRELASRGISVPALAARIRSELRDVSAGDVTLGRRRLLVRAMAVRPEPAQLESIVIATAADGTPLRLGDVADVRLGLRDPTGIAMSDDRPSLVLFVRREAGSNVLEVTQAIRDRVAELDRDLFAPEGLQLEVVSDQVSYIEDALSLVQSNLLTGALLAMIVLYAFLRSFGASAIISLSIPISAFGTMLGMSLMGRSLNVVSLAGITFAVGMVVDNSIVALENIDTWRQREKDPRRAAYLGIKEVWAALLASTATTAIVFVPVIGWEGEVGQLLRDVAVAISFAVITSLGVSVWVIPALAGKVLRGKVEETPRRTLAVRAREATGRAVGALTRSRLASAALVLAAVGGCSAFAWTMLPPLEYLPSGNRNLVFGILIPPPGTSVDELERVGRHVQAQMTPHLRRDVGGVPALERAFFVGSPERIFAGAVAQDPARVDEMLAFVQRTQSEIPGFIGFATKASLFGRASGGRSIEVNLAGSDIGTLTQIGGRMFGMLREAVPGAQVRPVPSLDPGSPELRAYPRRGDAAPLGVSSADLGLTLGALVDGAVIGELGPEGEPRVDVILRAVREGGERIDDPDAIRSAPVAAPDGSVVPFGVLAELREELGPTTIQRIERRRALTLMVAPPEEVPLETALERVESEVIAPLRAQGAIPREVEVTYSGTAGQLETARSQFANVLLLAVIICYLLMAAIFEDFLAPIVVLVTVPLAAAGGVGGLWLVSTLLEPQPLDLMTAVGFLILIGVVVNNAILVVDGALAHLREGKALDDAIRAAVEGRVRPILMTTLTSLAGLLPMVLVPGSGSELYRGVGAVVLGGLALSTALTIFVVPAFFSLVWRLRIAVLGPRPARVEAEPSAAE